MTTNPTPTAEQVLDELLSDIAHRFSEKIKPVPQHWIGGEIEQDQSYCRKCAEKKVREIKRKDKDADVYVDGGWDFFESDSTVTCATCNRQLECSYTSFGVKQELEHFEQNGFNINDPLDWYSLRLLLEHIEDGVRVFALRVLGQVVNGKKLQITAQPEPEHGTVAWLRAALRQLPDDAKVLIEEDSNNAKHIVGHQTAEINNGEKVIILCRIAKF